MAGKSQADFRAMMLGSKIKAAAAAPAQNGAGGGGGLAQSYDEAMAKAGGDPAKITGLVMPKHRPGRPDGEGESAASGYGSKKPNNRRMQQTGEQKKAKKEAKRKDSDQFELECPKEETVARIDAFVREYKAGPDGGDVRSARTLDMLHLSAHRPGFELTDSAEGLKWKLKLTVSESGLFTSEETARGVQHGDKALVRAAVDGGFEKGEMWMFFEQMKADVCRTNRKWRRIQQRGKGGQQPQQPQQPPQPPQQQQPTLAAPAAAAAAAPLASDAAASAPTEPIDLSQYSSEEQLLFKGPGAQALKAELQRLGLKCGGAPAELAARLFRSKGVTDMDEFKNENPRDVAQEGGKKKRKRKVGGGTEAASAPKAAAVAAPMDVDDAAGSAEGSGGAAVAGGFVRGGAGFTEADQERIATQATEVANARQKGTGLGFGS